MSGGLGLAYFADDKGRIVTEMSVARMAEDEVLLITAATAQSHDREWLLKHLDTWADAGAMRPTIGRARS